MADRIMTAFDSIRAEDALKEKTLEFLRAKINDNRKPAVNLPVRSFAFGFAMLLCVALAGIFSYNLYFAESAYIDFDVNPSIEISVNRLDRVIGVYAYNTEGERVLEGLDIRHKNYKDAIRPMLDAFALKGYLRDDGLVSVTLQTNDAGKETEMLSVLVNYVKTDIDEHHDSVQVDVFPVSGKVRNDAHELNLSPAKHLAILELQAVDPTATVESCRNHTIDELKSLTRAHGSGHHAVNGGENAGNGSSDNRDISAQNTRPHHGRSAGNHGHGGGHG